MNGHFGKAFDRTFRNVHAQGMTEYIVIVSLVAIACITVVTVFGQKVARLFKAATMSLDGGKPLTAEKSDISKVNTEFSLAHMENVAAK